MEVVTQLRGIAFSRSIDKHSWKPKTLLKCMKEQPIKESYVQYM